MTQQGIPVSGAGDGTKNTSVPAPPIQEGPGAITKDSLAAESSAFDDKYTQGVSGSSSTFNTTDTSGATTLPSAASAGDRLDAGLDDQAKGPSGQKYPESAGSTNLQGQHSKQGFSGAPSSDRTGTEGSGVYKTGLGSSGSSGLQNADPAPTYAQVDLSDGKPKGNNIQEGGFDSNAPNASFNTEIGTDQDPGRVGELHFQKQAGTGAFADAGSGSSGTQMELDTKHPYQALGDDQA